MKYMKMFATCCYVHIFLQRRVNHIQDITLQLHAQLGFEATSNDTISTYDIKLYLWSDC